MTDTDSRVSDAAWQWKNDQEGYDDWLNGLLRDCPEVWEASDGSAESIVTDYVHHLERLVLAAYGPEGLLPDHIGVTDAATDMQEMGALRRWLDAKLPDCNRQEIGTANVILALLDLGHTTVTQVYPVMQSIMASTVRQLRDAGVMK